MKITDFWKSYDVKCAADLARVLTARDHRGENAFVLTGEQEFPQLTVLVRGNQSVVYYFPHPDHAGFVSWTREQTGNEQRDFAISPLGDPVSIPLRFIIPAEVASKLALSFLENTTRSSDIEWFEL